MISFSGKLGERYFTLADIINFAFSVPVEIPSTNALFAEGANSTQNTVISLTGNAFIQGEEECYHNVSETNVEVINRTLPVLCLVSNTFWVFKTNPRTGDGECVCEINKGFNEFFQLNFPDLYARMAAGQ
jgi:hypothetical protein